MSVELIGYPNCSTCKKAYAFLKGNGVNVNYRHIIEQTPSAEELEKIWLLSKVELHKLFNTSGKLYREMKLKDKLHHMSKEEQLQLLSEHGMLIKRPILITPNKVIIGFQEKSYQSVCDQNENVL